jgi:hypothetical protein
MLSRNRDVMSSVVAPPLRNCALANQFASGGNFDVPTSQMFVAFQSGDIEATRSGSEMVDHVLTKAITSYPVVLAHDRLYTPLLPVTFFLGTRW